MPQQQRCYEIERQTRRLPTIYFEFDMAYGATDKSHPLEVPDYDLDGKNITIHRKRTHGFRLEMDGNRIELATKQFELNNSGHTEMLQVMAEVQILVNEIIDKCIHIAPDTSLGYGSNVGVPRPFKLNCLKQRVKSIFPTKLTKDEPYYRTGTIRSHSGGYVANPSRADRISCNVAAAPQATFELPLESIDKFVTVIRKSEIKQVAGKAFSGPPGWRQGVRSQALYDAQKNVNRSRLYHIRSRTVLPNGTVVTAMNFTPALQGFLILMVSYLRVSLLLYSDDDYEVFAKAYLPLNVKNPFRLLFQDLTIQEKNVFKYLYDIPRERQNLWDLASMPNDRQTACGDNLLFPRKVDTHQSYWFIDLPKWNDFVEYTIRNIAWIRTTYDQDYSKKGEDQGCEVLFAPLSRILPYERGSRRVAVEMRRLGFNYVWAKPWVDRQRRRHPGWLEMTREIFNLARRLNMVTTRD